VVNEKLLIVEAFDALERTPVCLVCPRLDSQGCACEAGMVSEGGDTSAGGVLEEFKVVEGTLTRREAGKNGVPAGLVLVAVCELDVSMFERN
jgi:hypothetical protein